MTLTEDFVLLYLAEALQPFFKPQGYLYLPGKKQFRRSDEQGFQNLILSVAPYDDAVLLEFHFGLRLHAVENIVQRFTRTLPGFYPDAHTCILSEGRLTGRPYLRHTCRHTEDLDKALHHLRMLWTHRAEPYLDEHYSLEGVDLLLNARPDLPSIYLPNPAHRYLKGLVVARLLQREDFESLARTYAEGLRQTPTGDLLSEDYQRLWGYLRQMSFN